MEATGPASLASLASASLASLASVAGASVPASVTLPSTGPASRPESLTAESAAPPSLARPHWLVHEVQLAAALARLDVHAADAVHAAASTPSGQAQSRRLEHVLFTVVSSPAHEVSMQLAHALPSAPPFGQLVTVYPPSSVPLLPEGLLLEVQAPTIARTPEKVSAKHDPHTHETLPVRAIVRFSCCPRRQPVSTLFSGNTRGIGALFR